MITILHVIADLLLFFVVVLYDRRISRLEAKYEALMRSVMRLRRIDDHEA